jgi:multidrug efflux pump subunit AcrB
MKSFFDAVTRLSLRFRAVTLALVVVVMVLGTVAGSQLKQELLPPIEFPQTFILAQTSGLSSEQVLKVVTDRLEAEISSIPEIVNLSSTSTSALGTFITAANDFGLNQQRLKQDIQNAIDRVWFPSRVITAPEGEDATAFAQARLGELTPEIIVYLAEESPNFAFELSPQVWQTFSDDSLKALLAYLANQTAQADDGKSSLERLVEQEIVPQVQTVDQVANASITGGQALPGEEQLFEANTGESGNQPKSFLLQLSPDVWDVVQARVSGTGELNTEAVTTFAALPYPQVADIPSLPTGWQFAHFSTAEDVLEMAGTTRSVARIINDFYSSGVIKGALGQTDDLTPEDIEKMLAIDPTMVNAFKAEHLVGMSPEVFESLPDEFVNNLDGFTRDELVAASLARRLSGNEAIVPVDLPSAWRIQPPQILTFSLASIPLATYSVFSTSEVTTPSATEVPTTTETTPSEETATTETVALPKGTQLPQLFGLIGEFFGAQLDTADDLVTIQLSGAIAEQFGLSSIPGSQLFNQLAQNPSFGLGGTGTDATTTTNVNVADFLPALTECGFGLLDPEVQNLNLAALIIGCLKPDAVTYLMENDPTFMPSLSAEVFEYLSPEVLALEGVTPPLASAWDTLAQQPQFANQSLQTAQDVVTLAQGKPAELLNQINANVPAQFAGYEVRLFDSLTPAMVAYFVREETDFLKNLDSAVVLKLSPAVLQGLPSEFVTTFSDELQQQIGAIASGETPSAATLLASQYATQTDVEPTDPNAPELNPEWSVIASFTGVELNNASDLFRLPEQYGSPATFINNIFVQAPGDFAIGIVSGMSQEAFDYVASRDANFVNELSIQALLALNPDILASLPQVIQDKATSGEVFIPINQVTRTNGAPSLLITITKDQDANTVEAYYAVKAIIEKIDEENENVSVAVAFEQSSFVEYSIAGVVREGTLGSFFAILIILVFLSGGVWRGNGRRIVGIIIAVGSAVVFGYALLSQWQRANGELGQAWDLADPVLRVLSIGGFLAGLAIIAYTGNLPYPAWRSTLVIAVSIPLSIFAALALMKWLPGSLHGILEPVADDSPIFGFLIRLAPKDLTLNIMTLSGLTVAVGRVVDDSIVVLENIFRQMQVSHLSKREAILTGTRDVSVAIFSATGITVVVFLPLGLTGGLIGEFFLPFGLAVTYALLTSFVVAITVIPVLVELFITSEEAHEEEEGGMQHFYVSVLKGALATPASRWGVIALAIVSTAIGGVLFASRPQAFIPDFGDPQISVAIGLPQGTTIIQTNETVLEAEAIVREVIPAEDLKTISTIVGGGGLSLASLTGGGGSVSENRSQITISIQDSEKLEDYTKELREAIVTKFGKEVASVSKATFTSQGGFGGFELVMSGDDQAVLADYEDCIIKILNTVEGVVNVTSNLSQTGLSGKPCDGAETTAETSSTSNAGSGVFVRINGRPALNFTGQVETEDTINLANRAIEAINSQLDLPEGVEIGQGYNSEFQQEGFSGIFVAMGIAIVIVVLILILVFGSPVYWFAVIFSILVAPVGAAFALTVTNSTLGISALIGLLMLLGLVVTNAVVLIDRVSSNRHERGMNVYDALVEAGGRRLRPILMTALATIFALMPLALGLSEGAIIAEQLGIVVIGGLLSSTLLTLVAVPAMYYITTPLHNFFVRKDRATGMNATTSDKK